MYSLAAEDASLAALEARATAAEQRLAALEAIAGGNKGAGLPSPPLHTSPKSQAELTPQYGTRRLARI